MLGPRLSSCTSLVVDYLLDSSHPMTLNAACWAVGEMGRCGPLLDVADPAVATAAPVSDRAVGKLLDVVGDAKTSGKIRERAAMAAGFSNYCFF